MFHQKFNRRHLLLALGCSSLLTVSVGCSYNDSSASSDSNLDTNNPGLDSPANERQPPSSAVGQSIFMNIMPAGSNSNSAGGLGGPAPFPQQLTQYPDNYRDQLDLYGNLAYAESPLQSDNCTPPNSINDHQTSSNDACNYYKPGGLTPVPGTVVESRTVNLTDSEGNTVVIERDQWGVPYINGSTRRSAHFGLGYASAQDRLWLWDLLRDLGRGEVTRKLGVSPTTLELDAGFGLPGGYSEAELNRVIESAQQKLGDEIGNQVLSDAQAFVNGLNAYIDFLQTPAGSAEIPPEYASLGLQALPAFPPRDFTLSDVVANAVLIQSALGFGGGGEAKTVALLQQLDTSIGAGTTTIPTQACELWRDIRHAADPEHTYSTDNLFATQSPPTVSEACPQTLPAGAVLWDVGSLQGRQFMASGSSDIPAPLVNSAGLPLLANQEIPLTSEAADEVFGTSELMTSRGDIENDHGQSEATSALSTQPNLALSAKAPSTKKIITTTDPLHSVKDVLEQLGLPQNTSNWLAVDGDQTESGAPIIVAGPQTGYFQPQLLWEAAMVSNEGTANDIAARGISTVMLPYITIGRGENFAWSPTSANGDLTDIRVSKLCNLDGSPATREDNNLDNYPDADGYVFKGTCIPLYARTDRWSAPATPASIALGGPAIQQDVERFILRTHYGPVIATALVNGEPVAISTQRSTFMADIDTAAPFSMMMTTGENMTGQRFRELFNSMTSTFNWLYTDAKEISFIMSGLYPQRHPQQHPELPVWGDGRFEWVVDQDLSVADLQAITAETTFSETNPTASMGFPSRAMPTAKNSVNGRAGYFEWSGYLPLESHVQDVNPEKGYLANWNNNGGRGWYAADTKSDYGASHRVNLLTKRLDAFKAAGRKHTLATMTEIMADAGYSDLRGLDTLPLLIELLQQGPLSDAQTNAITVLEQWLADGSQQWINNQPGLGALRRDRDNDGRYDHRAAVVLMDTWYQELITTMLPQLDGQNLAVVQSRYNAPGAQGSAYQAGWYEFMQRLLRTALDKPERVDYRVLKCANSDEASACRAAVMTALDAALAILGPDQNNWDGSQIYEGTVVEEQDSIRATTFGLIPIPPIHWVNRPTFQQAAEIFKTE